ncbi:hypothetical protein AB0J72_45185 [Dactylosporangium sp. NPDC049742]|uniref:hypothetical protein n=1 Tax=Dactylosporangium sp. NPDC049742 TaxID=3154737 RepID=UPI003449EF14
MTYGEMHPNFNSARLSQQVKDLGPETVEKIIALIWTHSDQGISDIFADQGTTVHLAPIRELRAAVRQGN